MPREITPDGLEAALADLSYPVVRPAAAAQLRDVTVVVEDREVSLGALVSETTADAYRTPEELAEELAALDDLAVER